MQKKKIIIVGAGDAGERVLRHFAQDRTVQNRYEICGFLDDFKKGQVQGVPVLGAIDQAPRIIEENKVQTALIAIPSATPQQIQKVLAILTQANIEIKIVPAIRQIIEGDVSWNQIRNVDVADLLGREEIGFDVDKISPYFKDQTVLITGGGGSIGSELVRQVLRLPVKKVLAMGHGENSLYLLQSEFETEKRLQVIVGDVKDQDKLQAVFQKYKPQVVFHAAAHKHVPLMEIFPEEAVKNNIFGTYNVAQTCAAFKCRQMLLISTDKAVRPSSVMGMTKRVAELIMQSFNQASPTRFTFVRFGNVLGSRGSVVLRFKQQLAQGGPLTVTHKDMERYFMLIPEAARLVIKAATLPKGQLFILQMGQPIKIYDLAQSMIDMAGLKGQVAIKEIGLRPGEKIKEELLSQEEGLNTTCFDKILMAPSPHKFLQLAALEQILQELKGLILEINPPKLRDYLNQIIQQFS